MLSIGWRNLRRDPTRAVVAILGVVFAVTLVTVEVGMLLGLVRNASLLIDRSQADLWVSTLAVKTFDFATPMDQRKKYRIQAISGVERVEEYNVSYSVWKLPNGGNVNVEVVAFAEDGKLAAPLDLVAGSVQALHNQDAVIIDEGDRAKLGNPKLGDNVEIFRRKAKVVGFTRGMKSFTTTPYVFTSQTRGKRYGYLMSGAGHGKTAGTKAIYLLIKLKPDADLEAVRQAITTNIPDIEVHTRASFSRRTRVYWLIETGIGLGFMAAALLGLAVGGVIVSQTLYAMTMEKLPEFGVLKAMGASMQELARIVLEQGLICGASGLLLGLLVSLGIAAAAGAAGTTVELPWGLLLGVTLLTAALCSCAALVSIARLRKVEPAMVFRT